MKNTSPDQYILTFNENNDSTILYVSTSKTSESKILQPISKYITDKNHKQQIEKKDSDYFIQFQNTTVQNISVPLSTLSGKSALQATTKYLKDVCGMGFSQIANLLNRNERTIWSSYNSSDINYLSTNSSISNQEFVIPLHIIANRNLSTLEAIVYYLKSYYCLDLKKISELLSKNYRTIWTVYKRALKKI